MEKIKQLLLWMIISLLGASAYTYQLPLGNFGRNLMAELIPGYVVPQEDGRTICINASEDGHFHLFATANGQTKRVLVDTGASDVSFDVETAKSLGVDTESLVFNRVYETANGPSLCATASIDSIKVGEFVVRNLSVSVGKTALSEPLLGMSFLHRLESYTFSANRMCMTFHIAEK